ncbi:hypothetical protein FACS1894145_4480 [Bacteroidia bacterium]|nr:hypothetical protein FACS1894145_4480 [Bacteroidia bacterium]
MRKYDICYSCQADKDLDDLFEVIVFEYGVPETAFKYVQGIIETIENLSKNPEIYAIRYNRSLIQYGQFVRRVNYKKMAILYSIYDNMVYIHRIIASSLITGL